MLLCFSFLIACPKHHHHHPNFNTINAIYSFEEVDFNQTDENTLVIFDIDDTLIFDSYKKCPAVLVEPIIISIMKKLRMHRVSTIGLTAIKTGKVPGLNMPFADWRIADLKKAGIIFNDPFKKTITFNHLKNRPLLKAGIIFTAWHDKGEMLKKVFSKTGCSFNKIIFFDDTEKNIASVSRAAEDLGVAFRGYIYKGVKSKLK